MIIYYFRKFYLKLKLLKQQIQFRNKNKHNNCFLKSLTDINKISIGNYSGGDVDVRLSDVENSFLRIGSFCCIGPEVEFICLSNHPYDWLFLEWSENLMTVKPLWKLLNFKRTDCVSKTEKEKIYEASYKKRELMCKGPIIIDDDVWIGTGAKIMSGVHVGQGAVIAAGAVVTKDIPPYAIVGGVPAKVIKYRFSESQISNLLKLDYKKIPIEKFGEIYQETITNNFNIGFILKHLKGYSKN